MQDLLLEQQKVLQRALELHATMANCMQLFVLEPAVEKQRSTPTSPFNSLPRISPTASANPKFSPISPSNSVPKVSFRVKSALSQLPNSSPLACDDELSSASVSEPIPLAELSPVLKDSPPRSIKDKRATLGLRKPLLLGDDQVFSPSAVGSVVHDVTKDFENRRHLMEETEGKDMEVEDLYKESGPWVSLMRNSHWQNTIFAVILLNTVYIALDTDYNTVDVLCNAPVFFQVMSNFFCCFFCAELIIRFLALKQSHFVMHDGWFVMDIVLVVLMVWETWVQVLVYTMTGGAHGGGKGVGCFSVLRVFRVFRLLRALRSVPELMILVSGMLAAMRSVLATVCLLALTIYLFSILFTQLLRGTDLGIKFFQTVPQSMQFLISQVLCGADPDIMTKMSEGSPVYYCLWMAFLFLGQLTIMNMLIGVVCNAIDDTTEDIHESVIQKQVTVQLSEALGVMGFDQNEYLTKENFTALMGNDELINMLYKVGIDLDGLNEFFNFVYLGVNQMSFLDVLDMILQFRQEKSTTVKDLQALRRTIHMELAALEDRLRQSLRIT